MGEESGEVESGGEGAGHAVTGWEGWEGIWGGMFILGYLGT